MKKILTIIIPSKNSGWVIDIPLKSISNQKSNRIETIIADNSSIDNTISLAKKYKSKYIDVKGKPPQVCKQRNKGLELAQGEYVFFLDHDVELPKGFFKDFLKKINKNPEVDAWYVPYRNVSSSKLLTTIRNFEDSVYLKSVVAAVRIVKKEYLIENKIYFDEKLSSGPADWDFDLQLKESGAEFGYMSKKVIHHEENLSFFNHIKKKTNYKDGSAIYIDKWKKRNANLYKKVVKKQFDPIHRLIGIFITQQNISKFKRNLKIYPLFLIMKVFMGINFFINTK